jgi:hypothetical protein
MTDTKDKREIEKKMRDNFDSLKRDEFMSLSEYLTSPIAVRDLDLQKKAFGGRIGFQDGRRVQPVEIPGPAEQMNMLMKRLMEEGGMSREEAEKEAETLLFGPSAMKLRDSKRGLGSMMAAADEDEYKSPPFIDDPEGRMETDEFEAIRQIMESGRLTQLDDDELFRMYDSLLESEAGSRLLDEYNINSFQEYKEFISRTKRRPEGIENIMPTMVA